MSEPSVSTAAPRRASSPFRLQLPVIIAAVILIVSILFFGCWELFFNHSVKGTWTLHFILNDNNCSVSYSFEDDKVCYFHNGGSIRKGTYQLSQDEDGHQLLTMTYQNFRDFGTPAVTHQLRYTIEGTAFGNRKMKCTDITGMIFDPDNIGSENEEAVAQKKAAADFIEENGTRYYVFTMHEDKNYATSTKPIEGGYIDKELLGIWLEKNEDSTYDNTFAFYEDGTIQITYRDRIYKGCYTAYNGECIFNLAQVDGSFANILINYEFKEGKLIITINDVPAEYTRTDDICAFETGIR